MRLPLLSIFVLAAFSATAAAQRPAGESSWYLELSGGASGQLSSEGYTRDIDFDTGYAFSGTLGWRTDWLDSERFSLGFELEGLYAKNDVDEDGLLDAGSSSLVYLSNSAILVNGILEWQWSQSIRFYGGAGIGYALDITAPDLGDGPTAPLGGNINSFELDDRSAFAFQGKLGLLYLLSGDGNLSADIGFRYYQTEEIGMTDSDLPGSFDLENTLTSVEVGIRWGL
jgi:opacity protein-like surface antigen